MDQLIAGERDPRVLAQSARGSMRGKIAHLEQAFVGSFGDHHAFLLRQMPCRIDALSADVASLDARIEEQIAPFAHAVAQLDEIPGVGVTAAQTIIAEIGLDMSRFPTLAHLASWARFAPASRNPPAATRATATPGNPRTHRRLTVSTCTSFPGSAGRSPIPLR
jgi:transposase